MDGAVSQSRFVGLLWDGVFLKGNSLGVAVGQPTFITGLGEIQDDGEAVDLGAYDGQYTWEWWYRWQVSDNISITPAVFYLGNPLGQLSRRGNLLEHVGNGNNQFDNFRGLVKTTFRF